MEIILTFLFAVGVITLIGHGIWVFLALILSALFGGDQPRPRREDEPVPSSQRCSHCDQPLHSWQQRCDNCGLNRFSSRATELKELRATIRQLDGCRDRGVLDDETVERVQGCIQARIQDLKMPAKTQPALASAPVSAKLAEDKKPSAEEILEVVPMEQSAIQVRPASLERSVAEERLVREPAVHAEPAAAEAPARRRRTVAEVLTAFMEERNILWGELIGGLLMVGCSIALVISLWKTLEAIPYFPFLIFAAITTSIFGAGLYTLHHWKLESTSRGLLVIATLLVPLNYLVMAGLAIKETGQEASGSFPQYRLASETLATVIFAYLMGRAARVLVPEGRWPLVIAVLGASTSQLAVHWLVTRAQAGLTPFLMLGAWPVACYAGAAAHFLQTNARRKDFGERQANALFAFLGITVFTVVIVLGFLAYWAGDIGWALQRLAPLIAGAGVPLLAAGLLIQRRLAGAVDQEKGGTPGVLDGRAGQLPNTDTPVEDSGRTTPPGQSLSESLAHVPASVAGLQTAGTAISLVGMVIMLAAVVMAWPQPAGLILVSALNVVVLSIIAFRCGLPLAHAAAMPCLVVGYLTAYHLLSGNLAVGDEEMGSRLFQLATSARSGIALFPLALLLGMGAELLARFGAPAHGIVVAGGGGSAALLSLILVNAWGGHEPGSAAVVTGLYAVVSLGLNLRWRRPWVSYFGLALLVTATLWSLGWNEKVLTPLWGAVLAGEALVFTTVAVWAGASQERMKTQTRKSSDLNIGVSKQEFRESAFPNRSLGTRSTEGISDIYMSLTEAITVSAWRDVGLWVGWLALGLVLWMTMLANLLPSFTHTVSLTLLATSVFLLAWAYPNPSLSWVSSFLILGALLNALAWAPLGWNLLHPWPVALLTHATLVLAGSVGWKILGSGEEAAADAPATPALRDLSMPKLIAQPFSVVEPFYQSAYLSALVSFFVILVVAWGELGALAGYLGWLSALLLGLAWTARSPGLFTLFQALLSATVCLAITSWVEIQPWFVSAADSRVLQAYGIGLGLLGLVWLGVRLGFPARERVQELLEPAWPAFDRLMVGLLVFGQLGLACWGILPRLLRELTPLGQMAGIGAWPAFYPHAYGPGAWALLGVLALVLIGNLWDQERVAAVLGLVLLALTVPVLASGLFAADNATASALRWSLGASFILMSGVLWCRDPITRFAGRMNIRFGAEEHVSTSARQMLVALTVVPVLVLTVAAASLGFQGLTPSGPVSGSFFANLGWTASSVIPLAMLSVGLVGHALREGSPGYAFAAGLVVNLAVTGGYALAIVTSGGLIDVEESVRLLQLFTFTAGLWALGWLLARPWTRAWREGDASTLARPLMTAQLGMAAAGNTWLLMLAVLMLVTIFPTASRWAAEVGSPLGWAALLLAIAAGAWRNRQRESRYSAHAVCTFGLAVLSLAACSGARAWPLWSLRGLLLAWAIYPPILVVMAWLKVWSQSSTPVEDSGRATPMWRSLVEPFTVPTVENWVRIIGGLVLLLGLKAAVIHHDYLWAAGTILLVSAAGVAMGVLTRREDWPFEAGLGVNLAGHIYWAAYRSHYPKIQDWLAIQVVCLGVTASFWTALELWLLPRFRSLIHGGVSESRRDDRPVPFYSYTAVVLGLGVLTVMAVFNLGGILTLQVVPAPNILAWAAWSSLGVALVLFLWDRHAHFVLGCLYALGLIAIAFGLQTRAYEDPRLLAWSATLALAGYGLVTAGVGRSGVRTWGQSMRLPEETFARPEQWYPITQATLAVVVALLSIWISLTFVTLEHRLGAALDVLLLVGMGYLVAETVAGKWSMDFRFATLALGVLTLTEAGWALLDLAAPALWLYRTIVLMIALASMTLVYGVGFVRFLPTLNIWASCGKRIGPVLGALASALLLVILIQEGLLFDLKLVPSRTSLALPAIVVVMAGLVVLMVAGISFAVVPGRDPLGLSESGRKYYVYAAEFLLVLLFVHTRLTAPELFRGLLRPYWTLIVMFIAFVGVWLAEMFERKRLHVLAEPLRRTGIFLPLLPLLVFWLRPPAAMHDFAIERFPGTQPMFDYLYNINPNYGKYAILWFLLSGIYAYVAVVKRSFRFAFLAALAANFGLWAILFHSHLSFLSHPQMWLIPVALIILISQHVNRDRLTETQNEQLRYISLMLIYVSSTADMFIAGLDNWHLPLILALLSVLGVLTGILLRVRAFLYLGTSFLVLVIFSQIWHAAVGKEMIWVWYVSGIILGAFIIALFAVFEKRRNDILRMIEEIKTWN